jgi:hypothetical protein
MLKAESTSSIWRQITLVMLEAVLKYRIGTYQYDGIITNGE